MGTRKPCVIHGFLFTWSHFSWSLFSIVFHNKNQRAEGHLPPSSVSPVPSYSALTYWPPMSNCPCVVTIRALNASDQWSEAPKFGRDRLGSRSAPRELTIPYWISTPPLKTGPAVQSAIFRFNYDQSISFAPGCLPWQHLRTAPHWKSGWQILYFCSGYGSRWRAGERVKCRTMHLSASSQLATPPPLLSSGSGAVFSNVRAPRSTWWQYLSSLFTTGCRM